MMYVLEAFELPYAWNKWIVLLPDLCRTWWYAEDVNQLVASLNSSVRSPLLRFRWSFINHREKLPLLCVTMWMACSGWSKVSLSLFTLYFVRKRKNKNLLWSCLIDHLLPPFWHLLKDLKADEKCFPTMRAWTVFTFKCTVSLLF